MTSKEKNQLKELLEHILQSDVIRLSTNTDNPVLVLASGFDGKENYVYLNRFILRKLVVRLGMR